MRFSHRTLIYLSGFVWLVVGVMLLNMGIRFLMRDLHQTPDHFSLVTLFSKITKGREQGALLLVALALAIGFFKGRTVLTKAATRQVKRILQFEPLVPLKKIYSPSYYILILGMIGLGVSMRFLPISLDTRGAIDIAIGSALIHGALRYFRYKELPE